MTDTDTLLDDYRARLRAASADLPAEVRDELLDDVEAHLAELRVTSPSVGTTRDALARIGQPEEIAAAARRELVDGQPTEVAPSWTAPPVPRPRVRVIDAVAVALLLVGALVLPVLGWFVGVALLWASTTWTRGEKVLGTLVVPGGLAAPLFLLFAGGQTCTSGELVDLSTGAVTTGPEVCEGFAFAPWIGIPLVLVLATAPAVVAGVLLRRAGARAVREPARA